MRFESRGFWALFGFDVFQTYIKKYFTVLVYLVFVLYITGLYLQIYMINIFIFTRYCHLNIFRLIFALDLVFVSDLM